MTMRTPVHEAIAQLQGTSLASLVQSEVERMIVAGELPPGSKLTEQTVAGQLGVSRGPVREAFRMLEEAGLVRTEKNRGVFVRDIALDEALEIFELRAVMEMYVGRKLAETATAVQIKALRGLVEAMDQASRAGDAQEFHRANLQFHDLLLQLAGNAKFAAMYQRLTRELSLIRRKNLDAASMAVYAREHRQIVKAIAGRDAEAAGQAMFDHVMNSRERTLQNYSGPGVVPAAPTVAAGTRMRRAGRALA